VGVRTVASHCLIPALGEPCAAVSVVCQAIWRHLALVGVRAKAEEEAQAQAQPRRAAEECFRTKKRLFRTVEEHILLKRVLTAISC
jgi:hypothetical protein